MDLYKMCVYKTTNLINGKIYIGKSAINKKRYIGGGKYLRLAIKKYGRENFKKEILENNIENKDKLNQRETYWINFYNSRDPKIGYNRSLGGDGFSGKRDESFCLKISQNHADVSGKNNPFFGKRHSEETKQKMSKNHWDCSGKNNPNYGGLSEEHCRNISKARKKYFETHNSSMKGKRHTQKTKEKISNSLREYYKDNPKIGYSLSDESKLKIAEQAIGKKKKKNASSKYVGVSYNQAERKWKSSIKIPGQNRLFLGSFHTEIEAALAYNEALLFFYGWKMKDKINKISKEEYLELWKLDDEN
jgi:group I intron endonuclease